MVQLILTMVNYVLVVQHIGQVTICVFPIIFGPVLLFPKISDSPNKTEGKGNVDEEDEVPPINQRQRARKVSVLKKQIEDRNRRRAGKSVLMKMRKINEYIETTWSNIARELKYVFEFMKSHWPDDLIKSKLNDLIKNDAKRYWDELRVVKKSLNKLNENAAK
ncbi:hypothetical protein SLA2020_182450 [Shorea laevis]